MLLKTRLFGQLRKRVRYALKHIDRSHELSTSFVMLNQGDNQAYIVHQYLGPKDPQSSSVFFRSRNIMWCTLDARFPKRCLLSTVPRNDRA